MPRTHVHARMHARWYGRGDRPTEIKSTSGGTRGDQGPRICCCWQGEAGEPAGESHLSAHASSYPFPPSFSSCLFCSRSLCPSCSTLYRRPSVRPSSSPFHGLLPVRPWGIYAISSFFPTSSFFSFLFSFFFFSLSLSSLATRLPVRSISFYSASCEPCEPGVSTLELVTVNNGARGSVSTLVFGLV